jgi:hypothetical protein
MWGQPLGKKYYPLTKQNRPFQKYAYTLAEIFGSNGLSPVETAFKRKTR